MVSDGSRTAAPPELLYLLHGDPSELAEALAGMRAADVAEALRELGPEPGAKVMAALPFDLAVQVFDEPELDRHRAGIVSCMPPQAAAALAEAMSADQRADLVRELRETDRVKILKLLEPPTRRSLEMLLEYPTESAGGIMTTEFVAIPATWTVEEALRYIGEVGRAKETVYAVYVLDPQDQRLVHVVSLRELMTAERAAVVTAVGDQRQPLSVRPLVDREEVARLISKYNLLAVPVIDIVREQTEDAQKFGGMEALDAPYMEIGFGHMIRKRGGWLCALFLSEMLTATAMQHFEGEIARAVVLSMFIPLVMSSGGNSGSQATSLIIRALALHEIRIGDWWRIAMRELPTGLVLGSILGVIGIVRIEAWQHFHLFDYGVHYHLVALTVGLALVGIVCFGSLAGSMLPFVLKRVGFDPASASAPFVATLVDVTGLVIYFTVALIVLRGTLL